MDFLVWDILCLAVELATWKKSAAKIGGFQQSQSLLLLYLLHVEIENKTPWFTKQSAHILQGHCWPSTVILALLTAHSSSKVLSLLLNHVLHMISNSEQNQLIPEIIVGQSDCF